MSDRKPRVKRSDSDASGAAKALGKRQKAKTASKHAGGRPSSYVKKLHPKLAYALAVRGLTDEEMAKEIGITASTFYLWKTKYPEFSESLKRGKEDPDSAVEGSLFKKAVGFKQLVKKPMVASGVVQIVEYEQTVDPDTTAQIFYLKNRRPDRWRDQQHIDLTAKDLSAMTPEEYAKIREQFLESLGGKGGK